MDNEAEALRRAAIAAHERGDIDEATRKSRELLKLEGLAPEATNAVYSLSIAIGVPRDSLSKQNQL
jgi:Flp pilus assembly protein TadD